MKKLLIICLLASACFSSQAQSQWYYYAEEFYFVKEVPVKEFRGKNFRYEIAVKAQPTDTLSKVRVHGINVGKGREDYLHTDFNLETRVEQDWTIYTIAGTVDENAWKLWFFAAVNGNGDFYFDDISFYIELEPGQWKQLNLRNTSFEAHAAGLFDGFYVSKRKSSTLTTKPSESVFKTGHQSLYVSSRNQQPASLLTTSH